MAQKEVLKRPPRGMKFLQEDHILWQRQKEQELDKKLNTTEEQFQKQENWWKAKFKEFQDAMMRRSTPASDPPIGRPKAS